MATASDFKVKVEELEGPDNWPKWKWQILMFLCVRCLEGITDGSPMCPILPADTQPQQKKVLAKWRKDDTAACIIAYTLSSLLLGSYLLVPVLKAFGISYVHGLGAVVCSGLTCSLSRSSRHNGTLAHKSLRFKNGLSTLTTNGRNTVQMCCLNVS